MNASWPHQQGDDQEGLRVATQGYPRRALKALLLLTILFQFHGASCLWAQSPGTGSAQPAPASTSQRDVSWGKLPGNFIVDEKEIWLFPAGLLRGHHWLPTLCVLGATAALISADSHDTPYFRKTSSFQSFNRGFSGPITASEIALVPSSSYLAALIRGSSYEQKTALFASEAVADSLALNVVMKVVSRRLRPSDILPNGNFSDTFFRHNASVFNGSFPSAHAMAAFSVATIFARRYRDHRWVPWVAYGMAGVICFSRITLQAHFPSDVFLGAALSYPIARFVVLQGE